MASQLQPQQDARRHGGIRDAHGNIVPMLTPEDIEEATRYFETPSGAAPGTEQQFQLKIEGMVRALCVRSYDSKSEFNDACAQAKREFGAYVRNSDIRRTYDRLVDCGEIAEHSQLRVLLRTKVGKSASGILSVTVFTSPYPEYVDPKTGRLKVQRFTCKWNCYYCPNHPNHPRSYLPDEPGCIRAERLGFDPYAQLTERVRALQAIGHPVDKLEVLVLGGTWCSYPRAYQRYFIRQLFYAANVFFDHGGPGPETEQRPALNLAEEQRLNETALCKIIGLTLETRPDTITPEEIRSFREFGCTRLQLGVQHLDNVVLQGVNRAHSIEDAARALRLLKDNCYKLDIHLMPDLPGCTPEIDRKMFRQLLDVRRLRRTVVRNLWLPNDRQQTLSLIQTYAEADQPLPERANLPEPSINQAFGTGVEQALIDEQLLLQQSVSDAAAAGDDNPPKQDTRSNGKRGGSIVLEQESDTEAEQGCTSQPVMEAVLSERDILMQKIKQRRLEGFLSANACPGVGVEVAELSDPAWRFPERGLLAPLDLGELTEARLYDYDLEDPELQADQWKIYPCEVTPWTVIEKWYKEGKYMPYGEGGSETLQRVLIDCKEQVFPWIRLNRVIRDIPNQHILGGNSNTSMRQDLQKRMRRAKRPCRCIRCREVGLNSFNNQAFNHTVFVVRRYAGQGGTDYFLSFESPDEQLLYGFLRLRISDKSGQGVYPVLEGAALIRELHVYGQLVPTWILEDRRASPQHQGFGRKLMRKAEEIAWLIHGRTKIAVIAGVGTRNYYRKLGYRIRETFLVKELRASSHRNPGVQQWFHHAGLLPGAGSGTVGPEEEVKEQQPPDASPAELELEPMELMEALQDMPTDNQALHQLVLGENPAGSALAASDCGDGGDGDNRKGGSRMTKAQQINRSNPLNPNSPNYDPSLMTEEQRRAKEEQEERRRQVGRGNRGRRGKRHKLEREMRRQELQQEQARGTDPPAAETVDAAPKQGGGQLTALILVLVAAVLLGLFFPQLHSYLLS